MTNGVKSIEIDRWNEAVLGEFAVSTEVIKDNKMTDSVIGDVSQRQDLAT